MGTWIVFEKLVAKGQEGEILRRIRDYYRRYWIRPVAVWRRTHLGGDRKELGSRCQAVSFGSAPRPDRTPLQQPRHGRSSRRAASKE
jgi:hypothetical protein